MMEIQLKYKQEGSGSGRSFVRLVKKLSKKHKPIKMAEEIGPKKQILITEQNVHEIVQKLYVKKDTIVNVAAINNLRHLCSVNTDNDPVRQLRIFQARKAILENSCEIFLEAEEEKLFDESSEELDLLLKILEKHTLAR
jgi:hypothetical protein